MDEFFQQYKYGILGGGVGLILAILLLTIGFLKTLLVIVCILLGTYIGFYLNSIGFLDRFKKNNR